VTTTKGGRARAVPVIAEVAQVLVRLGQRGTPRGPTTRSSGGTARTSRRVGAAPPARRCP
jgi:hypothetical protein